MRFRRRLLRVGLAATIVAAIPYHAAAQTGRVGGVVRDLDGQAIKGATVRAENPASTPSTYTSSTDEKGRFSVLGLRTGVWTFTAEAPGFTPAKVTMGVRMLVPSPPLTFALAKAPVNTPTGVLAGLRAKDLQTELAEADAFYNAEQWDQAIAAYKAILAKAPVLTAISLQIASAYRHKKDYDAALAAYDAVLKADPSSEPAHVGIAATNLERGDAQAAERALQKEATAPGAGRDVLCAYGDVKRAKGEIDEATKYYQKAAESDPTWGKPWLKLGLMAVDKGDKDAAARLMEKVIAVDPSSPEAIQAKAEIDRIRK